MKNGMLGILLLAALGCGDAGPQRAAVHGTITVDGTPLERGIIHFIPIDGTHGPGTGVAIENGQFALDRLNGPVVGTNRIEIRGFRKTGRHVSIMEGTADEEEQFVPAAFNEQSEEKRSIEPGDNTLDFQIATKR